jgi:hypothetical protein
MSMSWDHAEPFPRDPNAPTSPSDRVGPPRLVSPAARIAGALDRALAQLRLIGPAAGDELRCLVYGEEIRCER